MNTIVATRAGKDLISSLATGLLTIGSRFGGALDEAASMFSNARDTGLTPREFVDNSRKANKLSTSLFLIHLLLLVVWEDIETDDYARFLSFFFFRFYLFIHYFIFNKV